jgi:hypothetical protein
MPSGAGSGFPHAAGVVGVEVDLETRSEIER